MLQFKSSVQGGLQTAQQLSPWLSFEDGESKLLDSSHDEQDVADEHSQPTCPTYDELLDVMSCAVVRLDLPWKHEKHKPPLSLLYERFLSGHNRPARTSHPSKVCLLLDLPF